MIVSWRHTVGDSYYSILLVIARDQGNWHWQCNSGLPTLEGAMKLERYEIDPRAAGCGGGWQLQLIGRDEETGQEIDIGGSRIPIQEAMGGKYPSGKLLEAIQNWLVSADVAS